MISPWPARMLTRRRGESAFDVSRKSLFFIVVAFMLTIIFILYVFFIAKVNSEHIPEELRLTVHTHRFINTCFPYIDPDTQRSYSGVLDMSLFTRDRLSQCYLTKENKRYAYRLKVTTSAGDTRIETDNFVETRPYKELAKTVIVRKNGVDLKGTLTIGYQYST